MRNVSVVYVHVDSIVAQNQDYKVLHFRPKQLIKYFISQ